MIRLASLCLGLLAAAAAHAAERPAATLLSATAAAGGGWYASTALGEHVIDPTRLPEGRYGAGLAAVGPRGLGWTLGAELGRYGRDTRRQLGTETYDVVVRAHSWSIRSGVAQYWALGDGLWVFAGPELGVWSGRHTTKNGESDPTHHPRAVWVTVGARLGLLAPVSHRVWASLAAGHAAGLVHASEGRYDSVWWAGDTRVEAGLAVDVSARGPRGAP